MTNPTTATMARTSATAPMSTSFLAALGSRMRAQAPSDGDRDPENGGDERHAESCDEIGVHAVVELHDVTAGGDIDDELADRVWSHDRGAAVDRGVPTGVVGLTQDDLLAGL